MIDTLRQKTFLVTPPAAILDNASAVTNSIDTLGFDRVDIYIAVGATDIAMNALKLQESDTDAAYADIAGATFAGALPGALDDNKIFAFHVDMLGRKRFLDLVATAGDGALGTFVAAWAVLSRGHETPNDATTRGLAAELFV